MATAICSGLLEKKMVHNCDVLASDKSAEARNRFFGLTGVKCIDSNQQALDFADIIILAVKPQNVEEVLSPLVEKCSQKFLISIVAGFSISRLKHLSNSERIVRVMPNTPVMVGMGATVYSCSTSVSQQEKNRVARIFESVGIAIEMPEEKLDAVTGLSGSGPAYVFEFIQAMIQAGKEVGLDEEVSLHLTVQTLQGAAKMVEKKVGTPDELRDAVTSPGGTTQAGLNVLKKSNFRELMLKVVCAATERSIELGKK